MEVIRLDQVSLLRRTQEEFSYDLKKTILSVLEGKYRKPARKLVLDQIDLVVEAGEKVGIIGANGSGKSTLLKVICNILEPSSGKVRVRGNIAPLIELGAGFDPEISVKDNIILYGVMLGFSEQEMRRRIWSILEFAELEDYASVPVKALSSGMVARLGFAIATDVQPDILILDEVLSVGDESFKHKSKQRIERFWHANATILLVSHDLDFLQKSCQRVIWLDRGKVRMVGESEQVVQTYIDSVRPVHLTAGAEADLELEPGDTDEVQPGSEHDDDLESAEHHDGEERDPDTSELDEATSEPLLCSIEVEPPTGEICFLPPAPPSQVALRRLFFANLNKHVITEIDFGMPFYVGVEYSVESEISSLRLGFRLSNATEQVLLDTATSNYLPQTGAVCSVGTHYLYFKIPSPLLIPGRYHISALGAYQDGFGHHHFVLGQLLALDVLPTAAIADKWIGYSIMQPPLECWIE